jgi:hypothetical protein
MREGSQPMSPHKWQFASRLKRNAFGWKSDTPIQRIKEAITEIKLVAKKEPVIAAEGAVILLEKLPPALEQVDSSSGALGSAVHRAMNVLVQIITKPNVEPAIRQRWLERLWTAVEDDGMTYIEPLGDYWGDLCATTEIASYWADQFLPLLEYTWGQKSSGHSFYKGTIACMASLYASGRHDELLNLLDKAPFKWWLERRWGVKALVAQGKKAEAIHYAEESRGLNDPGWQIAQACEEILLSSGLYEEAYRRYALEANRGTTNLATFRAITKKYPHKPASDILRDLVASTPGSEGKWFAAAKDAGMYDAAIELVSNSPADPRTLTRAARDYASTQPTFALEAGLAALRWIAAGHGYEITGADVLEAYQLVMQAAPQACIDGQQIKAKIKNLLEMQSANRAFMQKVLAHHLGES